MLAQRKVLCCCGILVIFLGPLSFSLQAQTKSKDSSKVGLKFEVYQDAAKEFRWRLVASDDKDSKVLATGGQGYKAKADCLHGVKIIQEGADKLTYETYQDKGGDYRWRAKSSNGQVVGASGSGYKTKSECEKAADVVKKGAAKATEEEVKEAKT
jgi:uncharacterized protein YegP (UPF0339 family)